MDDVVRHAFRKKVQKPKSEMMPPEARA
jgi:hypothetical protein